MNDTPSRYYALRNHTAKVALEYEIEIYGAKKKVTLPWVTGVLADLSGKPSDPLPPLGERRFVELDIDNFDARMKAIKPRVAFLVPNTLTGEGNLAVEIVFDSIGAFEPDMFLWHVEPLRRLFEIRQSLEHLIAMTDGKERAQELLTKLSADAQGCRWLAESSDYHWAASPRGSESVPPNLGVEAQEWLQTFDAQLPREFEVRGDEAIETARKSVRAYAWMLTQWPELSWGQLIDTAQALIANLDRALTQQLNQITSHSEFRRLEATWRGLYALVVGSPTGESLRIRVMNVSKNDLGRSLKRYRGTIWRESPLAKAICTEELEQLGGQPFGVVVADYPFDQSLHDVEILGELARIGEAAHAPFLAEASPSLMQMESWMELGNPRDLSKMFEMPEYAAWRSLRDNDRSRYLCLTMPNVLARLPHAPNKRLGFDEATAGGHASQYVWSNAAYSLAGLVHEAHLAHGWPARIVGIEGGGTLDGLPVHRFPDDYGGYSFVGPTQVDIPDRRVAELTKLGLMALVRRKGSDTASFVHAPTLHRPARYDDGDVTRAAALQAWLPYVLAVSRIAVYLRCFARDTMGSQGLEDAEVAARMNEWLAAYVDTEPVLHAESAQAARPLADAEVAVVGDVSRFLAPLRLHIRPQYQLDAPPLALTVGLTLRASARTEKSESWSLQDEDFGGEDSAEGW